MPGCKKTILLLQKDYIFIKKMIRHEDNYNLCILPHPNEN